MFYPFQEGHRGEYLDGIESGGKPATRTGATRFPHGLTLDMLNTQLVDQTGRKDSTGKSTTEDRCEFVIQTTDTHIFEFEVRRDDSRRGSSDDIMLDIFAGGQWLLPLLAVGYARHLPVPRILQLHVRTWILGPSDLGPIHNETHWRSIHSIEGVDSSYSRFHEDPVEVKDDRLDGLDGDPIEGLEQGWRVWYQHLK